MTLWLDIRYAARKMLARPTFAVASILSLALGIGACVAIFSIVDAVLWRPLPYPDAHRIVELKEVSAKGALMRVTDPNLTDVRARNHSLEAIAEYSGGSSATMMTTILGGNEPVRAPAYAVSAEFFRVLGVTPIVGRNFVSEEAKTGATVAMVSYGFWQRQLGAKTDLSGVTLRIEGHSFPVVGVLPPNLNIPQDAQVLVPRELFPPDESRTAHNWSAIAKLRPEVTLDSARADLSAIGKQLKRENGANTDANDLALVPLQQYVVGNVKPALLAILAAVGFLLLVAFTNVANLRLAQMTAREKEFAVRAALGAGRLRLAQQFLTENMLLTLTGGAVGVLLSFGVVRLILELNRGSLPRADEIGVNTRALVFALALSFSIALLLGLVSLAQFGRRDLRDGLKDSSRGQTTNLSGRHLRGFFVVAQIAMTLILLIGAGLLGRSFVQLMRVDPGFRPDNAAAMNLSLPASDNPDQKNRNVLFYQQLLEGLGRLPGVVAVGGINGLPMTNTGADGTFLIDNDQTRPGHAEYRLATSGYFAAMGIPLLRGRIFDSSGGPGPPTAVISQSLAQKYFSGIDPIGKHIQFGNMDGDTRLIEIVGIVGDVREYGLESGPPPTLYANAFQRPLNSSIAMVVRAQGDPATLVAAMRQEAQALNPEIPLMFRRLTEVYSASLDARRFSLVIFGVFAAVTLILATLGLYGVISYTVAQRTHEIGIRRALGAQGRDVLGLVLRRGLWLTSCGVGVGLAGSLVLTRSITSLLFGVTPYDPQTFAVVTLLLTVVALIACLVPARRATKVDPLVALRYE